MTGTTATDAPAATVTVVGALQLESSNRLERHLRVYCDTPYPHETTLTVRADDGQDDDALTEALDPHLHGALVSLDATIVDGRLEAFVADIHDHDRKDADL